MNASKTCKKCGYAFTGRHCAACRTAYVKEWSRKRYIQKREQICAANEQWRQLNKDRVRESARRRHANDIERYRARKRAAYAANPEPAKKREKEWYARNLELGRALGRASAAKWAKENPARANAQSAGKRAKRLAATPVWANQFFIEEAYHLAKLRTEMLGFAWHVDHIVPLKSRLVCGLHVEHNIRVIPGTMNNSKGNRHWPGMP